MPAYSEHVPLDRLRAAVDGGVTERSLRGVAREVGMSPSGLQKFREGATPYSSTRRKLEQWYLREAARHDVVGDADPALAALRVLTSGLPTAQRLAVAAGVMDLLESAYRKHRLRSPAWLAEVRARLGEGKY